MAYEQLTLETFRKRLENKHYTEPGHARKAIGKAAGMTAAQKETAKKLVEQHFGDSSKKSSPMRATSKPAAPVEKAAVRPAKKVVTVTTEPARGRGRGRKPAASASAHVEEGPARSFGILPIQTMTVERAIELAKEATNTVQRAFAVAQEMAAGHPEVDLTLIRAQAMETVEKAGSVLSAAAGVVHDCSRRTTAIESAQAHGANGRESNGHGEDDPTVMDRLRRAQETVDSTFTFEQENEADV